MTVKEHVANLLADVPDDITWKQIRHDIWVLEQVEIAQGEIDRGETVPHEVVVKEFEEWVAKSRGRPERKKTSSKYSRTSKKLHRWC